MSSESTPPPSNVPAILSAVAAVFSAASAVLMLRIQRRNQLDAVRPEIVVDGWIRQWRGVTAALGLDVIKFERLRNIGRGAALQVTFWHAQTRDNQPQVTLTMARFPIIAPNEGLDVGAEIDIWWKNIEPDKDGHQHIRIPLSIYALDTLGIRHEFRHDLFVMRMPPGQFDAFGVTDEVAPGVLLTQRIAHSTPLWWFRLRGRTGRAWASARGRTARAWTWVRDRSKRRKPQPAPAPAASPSPAAAPTAAPASPATGEAASGQAAGGVSE